jgi:hypothetical protein
MKAANVQWLLTGNPLNNLQAQSSNLASIRMRAALTMYSSNPNYNVTTSPNFLINNNTNIIGIGKISILYDNYEYKKWLTIIKKKRAEGVKVFLDYTDNHLRETNKNSDLYNAYYEIIHECDSVVCSSEFLKESMSRIFKREIFVIEDPLEVDLIPPKNSLQNLPTGLWFGHTSNLIYLINFLQYNFKPSLKLRLIIMSNIDQFTPEIVNHLEKHISPFFELIIAPWSIDNMISASKISDFSIIPCGILDERKMGVSSNRLITALALGLPCFADNAPSYVEFSNYYNPLSTESVNSFYLNMEPFIRKTLNAQIYIKDRFNKNRILNEWFNFFDHLLF